MFSPLVEAFTSGIVVNLCDPNIKFFSVSSTKYTDAESVSKNLAFLELTSSAVGTYIFSNVLRKAYGMIFLRSVFKELKRHDVKRMGKILMVVELT